MLGELTPSLKDAFEEHYFDCHVCSEELRTAAMFSDNARAVLGERTKKSSGWLNVVLGLTSGWDRPSSLIPTFATVAFAFLAGYQYLVVVPGLKTEISQVTAFQSVPEFALKPPSRGTDRQLTVERGARMFDVRFDIAAATPAPSYQFRLADASGALIDSKVDVRPAGDSVTLRLDSAKLREGDTYVISALPSTPGGGELAPLTFEFHRSR